MACWFEFFCGILYFSIFGLLHKAAMVLEENFVGGEKNMRLWGHILRIWMQRDDPKHHCALFNCWNRSKQCCAAVSFGRCKWIFPASSFPAIDWARKLIFNWLPMTGTLSQQGFGLASKVCSAMQHAQYYPVLQMRTICIVILVQLKPHFTGSPVRSAQC